MIFDESRINMLKICLFLSVYLFSFSVVSAQTDETINQLTPVPSNIGKFSKRLPRDKNSFFDKDNLKFEISVEPVNLPNNKKAIAIIIKTTYREITFESISDKIVSRLKIYGRITSKDEITDGFFEDFLKEQTNSSDFDNQLDKEVVLRKVFELPDGKYQIGVIVKDWVSGLRGVKVKKFDILNP